MYGAMYGKAKITVKDGATWIFGADDEGAISNFLYDIVGESTEEEPSGVPTFIEASSWCPMAGIGETFERKAFVIEIVDNDD